MLNRRSARIKVMQGLYAISRNTALSVDLAQKELDKSMQAFINSYYFVLYCAVRVIAYLNTDASIKAAKYLPTEADRELSLKLLDNKYFRALEDNNDFQKIIEKERFRHLLPDHTINTAYKNLVSSDEYLAFLANKLTDDKDDKEIFTFLVMKILLDHEAFLQHMEDTFSNWYDDNDAVAGILQKRLRANNVNKLIYHKDNHWEETYKFGKDLLTQTVDNKAHLTEIIGNYLRNWDADRLALMDTILLELAVAELLYFPDIPVKVSINEYIDISKEYSTPKSKEFINGILDKLMRDLMASGKIVKTGRGLKN